MQIKQSLLFLFITISGNIFGQFESCNVEFLDKTLCNPCYAIEQISYTSYIAADDLFLIMYFSDPANPVEAGHYSISGRILDIAIQDDYAFLVAAGSGMKVIDISDSSDPEEIAFCGLNGRTIAVNDDYVFIANYEKFYAIDIRYPFMPTVIGSTWVSGIKWKMAAEGDYAYITCGSSGMKIIDVTDPTIPVQISHLDDGYYYQGLDIRGDLVFLCGDHFSIADISDPTAPYEINCVDAFYSDRQTCKVQEDYAYLLDRSSVFYIYDISDLDSVTLIRSYDPGGSSEDFDISGDHAYITYNDDGIRCIDISVPYDTRLESHYDTYFYQYDFCVEGNLGYLATSKGLKIYSLPDSASTILLSTFNMSNEIHTVAVSGDYAYIGGPGFFKVVDISDSLHPFEVDAITSDYRFMDIFIEDDRAFVANAENDLLIYDISDPLDIEEITSQRVDGVAYGVYVSGDYAYIASHNGGLCIIDISDETSPEILSYISPGGDMKKVCVEGNYAYLAAGDSGLYVVNISDPLSPYLTDHFITGSFVSDVEVMGDFAYISDFSAGLLVLDISNHFSITQAGIFRDTDFAFATWCDNALSITVRGDFAYLCYRDFGLYTLDISHFTESINETSGITKPENQNIEAYPNPFNSAIKFEIPKNAKSVGIYDSKGKLLERFSTSSSSTITWQPDIETVSGLYIISAENSSGILRSVKVLYLK